MNITFKVAAEKEKESWDRIVEESPHSTIFHKWEWLKSTEKNTGCKLHPLFCMKGESLAGILPIFYRKISYFNIVFSPPPKALLLYLGPVICNYEQMKQSKRESIFLDIMESLISYAKRDVKGAYLRIRTSPGISDSRPLSWAGFGVTPLYTYVIPLSGDSDKVWESFNSQVRIDINKTIKEGVNVSHGSKDDLEKIRKMVSDRFVEQGVKNPVSYRDYLFDIYKKFHPEHLKIFVAKYNGEVITGLTLLCFRKRASLWLGIPKTQIKGIYPNDLLQWEAIKWACENGYEEFEIMDAGDDPRLRHFKSKFNPDIVPWFSADFYNSKLFKIIEKGSKGIFSTFKMRRMR